MMREGMAATGAVEPPRRAFLRAGYTRICEHIVYLEFFAVGEWLADVAVGDRLTGSCAGLEQSIVLVLLTAPGSGAPYSRPTISLPRCQGEPLQVNPRVCCWP